ncbi:MAG: polyketide cyclase [Edafosvirus sp.]|uniref:Polyketide cyclase n=1 Tax=Edafosvirus sp. TaxID=2487765 RepID=A0A3G4ZXJ4_9VIRU|nr:MAG: polyketide cyclase [Edafosvirus sp.]
MENYKEKYLKYKQKYKQLKNQKGGNNENELIKKHLQLFTYVNNEGFNKRNWEVYKQVYDKDIIIRASDGSVFKGVEKTIKDMKQLVTSIPDMMVTSQPINFGAKDWTVSSQKFSGSKSVMNLCSICQWKDNKVIQKYIFWQFENNSMVCSKVVREVNDVNKGVIIKSDDHVVNQNLNNINTINFEGFNKRNWNLARKYFDNNIITTFANGMQVKGVDANENIMKESLIWAPDSQITEHKILFGSGDWTCTNMYICGTFTKPMVDPDGSVTQPNGKKYNTNHCALQKWKNNKILEVHVFMNMADMMSQLDLIKCL